MVAEEFYSKLSNNSYNVMPVLFDGYLHTVNSDVELMLKADMTAMVHCSREDTDCLTIALIIQKACLRDST